MYQIFQLSLSDLSDTDSGIALPMTPPNTESTIPPKKFMISSPRLLTALMPFAHGLSPLEFPAARSPNPSTSNGFNSMLLLPMLRLSSRPNITSTSMIQESRTLPARNTPSRPTFKSTLIISLPVSNYFPVESLHRLPHSSAAPSS